MHENTVRFDLICVYITLVHRRPRAAPQIMVIGWTLFAPCGIMASRYFKHTRWWQLAHKLLLQLCLAGAIPIALNAVLAAAFTDRAHSWIGIALFAVVAVLESGTGYAVRPPVNAWIF